MKIYLSIDEVLVDTKEYKQRKYIQRFQIKELVSLYRLEGGNFEYLPYLKYRRRQIRIKREYYKFIYRWESTTLVVNPILDILS